MRPIRFGSSVYTPATLLLAAIVGVSFLGLGFVMPLRSLYASDMGATGGELGLMSAAFMGAGLVAAPTIGRLSDRLGHARLLWVGLTLHATLVLAYLAVADPVGLIALRACEGVATACAMPPSRALMNRLVPDGRRGEGSALLSNARTIGILLGPAVGALLASAVGYAPSFLCACACLVVGALAAGLVLGRQEGVAPRPAEHGRRGIVPLPWTPTFGLTCLVALVLALPQGLFGALWSVYMRDRGASLALIGLSFTAFALLPLVVGPLTGRWSDRRGRLGPLVAGTGLLGLIYAGYAASVGALAIVALSFAEGAPTALARSAADGLSADVSPPGAEGRAQARFTAAQNAGSLIGAAVGGFLYAVSDALPFALLSAAYLATAVLLVAPGVRRLFARPALVYPVVP